MSSLPPGTRVGPYEVLSAIGAGGMGQVFRARDTSLHREVAVKILPPSLAGDSEYRDRFSREARVLASLNHPHIAQVYGLEDSTAGPAIVMELVPGVTLKDRLRSGIARAEALRLAQQIAAALDAAHEKGIVHRDLKPGNIMVTPDGAAKVLDFGLAKTSAGPGSSGGHDTTMAGTVHGAVVGTPAYMSPEQARGQVVDRRTDIWAFGCVLYELLAGRPAFKGDSGSDVISAILEREPDWRALPADAPEHLRRLAQRCLEKDRRARLRDIGDALYELSAPTEGPQARVAPRARVGLSLALTAAALVVGALATWLVMRDRNAPPPTPEAIRFALPPPRGSLFGGPLSQIETTIVAVSPDGSSVAFVATRSGEPSRIWVRPLSDEAARAVPGTEAAFSVFWSPDGRSLGFVSSGQLKRVDLGGGAPVKICDVPVNVGVSGSWGREGDILFATVQDQKIWRVRAGGGAPVPVVDSSGARSGRTLWPLYLPDGRHFIYSELAAPSRIILVGPDGHATPLVEAASRAQWIDPNWLVYVREGTLLAQRVDLGAAKLVGDPVSIMGTVAYSAATGWSNVAASLDGTLVVQWVLDDSRVAWFEPSGRELEPVGAPGAYAEVRLSSDDSTLLFERVRPELGTRDIWATDLARRNERPITTSPGMETGSAWVPGGRAVVYAAAQGGPPNLIHQDLATGQLRRLMTSPLFQFPNDVSADGTRVIYQQRTPLGTWDLMAIPVAGENQPAALFASDASEFGARLAPGGAQMSYTSDESGRQEIYLSPFPVSGGRTAVSTAGGVRARWGRDGRELYFISGERMLMAVAIDGAGRPGAPRALFAAKDWLDYDVARDGRFIAVVSQTRTAEQPLAVIVNWSPPGGR